MDIDCGYRGPARDAPIFRLLATFHSSATQSGEAPDLMLWLSDPRGTPLGGSAPRRRNSGGLATSSARA
jgi:hypothetical protein